MLFYLYALVLMGSGIAMLVIAGVKSGQRQSRRIWNALFGAGADEHVAGAAVSMIWPAI